LLVGFALSICFATKGFGQCAICSRTAQQMGEKPAQGLNSSILYLMATPFLLVGFIGYRWWKNNGREEA